jgi:CspA family cold shock protein
MNDRSNLVSNMVNGVCKWFNSRKGYGFLTPEGAPEGEKADVFVHHTNIKMEGFRALYEGDKVTFDIEDGTKGKEAKNVVIIEKAPRPKRRRGPRKEGAAEGAAEGKAEGMPEGAAEVKPEGAAEVKPEGAEKAAEESEAKPKKGRKKKSDSESEPKPEAEPKKE